MKSKKGCWEFLPHTADAKFKAWGKNISEAYRNAARAMFAVITDVEQVREKMEFPINKKAKNREATLFDFLDELLFLLDTKGFILHDIPDLKVTQNQDGSYLVTGTAKGDHHKKYDVAGNVKAVTYNEMHIKKLADDKWECQVVVDL